MTTPTKPPIAENLRELKASKGCTALEMAIEVDVTERTVRMWLAGDSLPEWSKLCGLATFFGVRPSFFYDPPAVSHAG